MSTKLETAAGEALKKLYELIDGGEECRGMDSAISDIIRVLESGFNNAGTPSFTDKV